MLFNTNLKHLRMASALMQKDIAKMLNVSVRTFQGWETGRTEPNIEKLIQIADLFDVSIDALVGRTTPSPSGVDVEEFEKDPQERPNE